MPGLTREQKLQNNSAQRLAEEAGRLMPVRSSSTMRQFEAAEPGQFGAIDPGALALLGHSVLYKAPYALNIVSGLLLRWTVPDGRRGTQAGAPGEVSRIDVSRRRASGDERSRHTLTHVSFYSAPLTLDGVRLGVGVNVENRGDNVVGAAVELAIASDDRYPKPIGSAVFNAQTLSPLDRGHPGSDDNALAARLPVLEGSASVLAGIARNLGASAGIRVAL